MLFHARFKVSLYTLRCDHGGLLVVEGSETHSHSFHARSHLSLYEHDISHDEGLTAGQLSLILATKSFTPPRSNTLEDKLTLHGAVHGDGKVAENAYVHQSMNI